jgi:lysophospholipase L1-like esterase
MSQNFNNKDFQFVGTQTELYPTDGVSILPSTQLQHEGYPGITIAGLSLKIASVSTYLPDILILQVGANDIAAFQSGSIDQIVFQYIELVKKIQNASPQTIIYACELTAQSHLLVPPFNFDRTLVAEQFNTLMPIQLRKLPQYGTTIKFIRHSLLEADLRDGLHPNNSGYQKFAEDLIRGF